MTPKVIAVAENPYKPCLYLSLKDKETWILLEDDKGAAESFIQIKHTHDPEFDDENNTVRITGKINLQPGEEIPSKLIKELLDNLETKVKKGEEIIISGLPYILTDKPATEIMFGNVISFEEVAETNAVIMRIGKEKNLILSSNEGEQKNRYIFIYKDISDAALALTAYKAFPPFKENRFYTSAVALPIADLDKANLKDEKFIYFDFWQKSVANLSAMHQN